MKTLALAFALLFMATIFVVKDADAATQRDAKKKQKQSQTQAPKKKLSTNLDFDDRTVGGKYNFSTEAITTVENDKSLDDLIGVRKNFKDRIERSESLR
ncbi:MAG: hypothetical protein V4596_08950 [Bdellovibrionota bacterium]